MTKTKLFEIDIKEKIRLQRFVNDPLNNKNDRNIYNVILLYYSSLKIDDITKKTGVKKRTIYNYINAYKKDKNFLFNRYHQRKSNNVSKLEQFEFQIADDFKNNPITSYKQATLRIKEITGISRSETQVRNFLKKHDFNKNAKGRYVQYQSIKVKKRAQKRAQKENMEHIDTSYLEKHKKEIIEYAEGLPEYHTIQNVVSLVKDEFPLIKVSSKILEKFLTENSPYL